MSTKRNLSFSQLGALYGIMIGTAVPITNEVLHLKNIELITLHGASEEFVITADGRTALMEGLSGLIRDSASRVLDPKTGHWVSRPPVEVDPSAIPEAASLPKLDLRAALAEGCALHALVEASGYDLSVSHPLLGQVRSYAAQKNPRAAAMVAGMDQATLEHLPRKGDRDGRN